MIATSNYFDYYGFTHRPFPMYFHKLGDELRKTEQVLRCFDNGSGFNCAQSILSSYACDLGMDKEMALRLTTAFGSGIARMGEICGAVTGAIMVIGLKHGRTRIEDQESREIAYSLVHEFVQRFKERKGSIVCREILGCDPGTEEGQQQILAKELHKTVCPAAIRDAAEILDEIL
jgi:C_GCAxxG_C_C family probable redox protein